MISNIILFLLLLLIVFLGYYKYKIDNENFDDYSPNKCGNVGKTCSIHSNGVNTCCDGLYCIRQKGNYYNKICSKTEESREGAFSKAITKFGDGLNKFGKDLKINSVIEECNDDDDDDFRLDYDPCGKTKLKLHLGCHKKRNIDFPETTFFSTSSKGCYK